MDRADTGWDAILKLAAEQTPNAVADTAPPVLEDAPPVAANVAANAPHAPHVGDSGTAGENDKSKLAKRVKLARSTDLWCLLPFTPVTQEAMDKPRKVCRSTSGGRSARPQTAGTSTRRSVSWPTTAREKSPRQRACCGTCAIN
jgi:hypothetical protein